MLNRLIYSNRFDIVGNEQAIQYAEVLLELNLDSKAGLMVNDLKQDTISLEVAQFKDEPLYDQVIVNYNDRVEPEIQGSITWFYYSPNVIRLSPKSYANKARLIEREAFNDYAWLR